MIHETDGYDIIKTPPVVLISHMGDDNMVVDCARVSYHKRADTYEDNRNAKLLNWLAKNEHWSPFAHPQVQFRFRACISIARQFQKHQVGLTWNEVSRRYVSTDPKFLVIDSFRMRPDSIKQGSTEEGAIPVEGKILDAYVDKVQEDVKDYREMMRQGICPEQARLFMPQSMMTEWIWTGSLYAWFNFAFLRGNPHAQAECWPYAKDVEEILCKLFPISMEALYAAKK